MSGDPFDRFLDEPPTPNQIDAILEKRNDGPQVNPSLPPGVPHAVMERLLDDMARMSAGLRRWTCGTYHMYGLHQLCPHHQGRRVA